MMHLYFLINNEYKYTFHFAALKALSRLHWFINNYTLLSNTDEQFEP